MPYKDPQKKKEWREKNSAYMREKVRQWREKNPDYAILWYAKNIAPFTKKPQHLSSLSGRDVIREKVRKRDKYTCQGCSRVWEPGTRRFDVHHLNGLCGKKSKKYDRVAEIGGLITLCHRCHYRHPLHTVVVRMAAKN